MTIDEIQSKFTRVVKIAGEWSCYLQVENQSFCITSGQTKQGATWYAKMLAIALERMIEIVKNTDSDVLTDCIEALEIGLNYVECNGWTRTRDKEIAIIQAAIDKTREVLKC